MSQTSKKLENGMLIASDRMDSIETVSVSVLVKTGSRYEDEKNNGISHFLEHMAFKGTATRNAKQIAEEFDKIGGHFNAYTSREKTVYYAKVLKKRFRNRSRYSF
jgi:predicted Zn-dependent peptidase